jgi:hypothetical protein
MSKHMRRNPNSKKNAQKCNKAGDTPSVHGKSYRHKIALLRSLCDGKLSYARKECGAEWRDGHRLVTAGLVVLEHKGEDTLWLRPIMERPTAEYRQQLAVCLKGVESIGPALPKSSKDKDSFYNFDPKDKYNDQPDKALNMAAIRFRNAKPPKKGAR